MIKRSLYICLSTCLIWLATTHSLWAQCSQCKAAAASEDGSGGLFVGSAINTGVLYLLSLPILLPLIVGGIWYVYSRKLKAQQD